MLTYYLVSETVGVIQTMQGSQQYQALNYYNPLSVYMYEIPFPLHSHDTRSNGLQSMT